MPNAPMKKAAAKAPAKAAAKTAPAKAAPSKAAGKTGAAPARIGIPDLTKLVQEKATAVSLPTINAVVNATFATIAEQFKAGNVIVLKDFGKFELKDKPARKGRNPATGETIDIAAKIVPKFTFASALKNG